MSDSILARNWRELVTANARNYYSNNKIGASTMQVTTTVQVTLNGNTCGTDELGALLAKHPGQTIRFQPGSAAGYTILQITERSTDPAVSAPIVDRAILDRDIKVDDRDIEPGCR